MNFRRLVQRSFASNSKQSRHFSGDTQLRKTALYDFHVSRGGKMVEFGGWSMPVQYKDLSISESTVHTRQSASLFDVSHMGQLKFYGKNRIDFLERIVISSIKPLKENQVKYTLMCNDNGGTIDDLVIANRTSDDNCHYMVINAGRTTEDLIHINEQLNEMKTNIGDTFDCNYEHLTEQSLVAYQGPKAVAVLSRLVPEYDFSTLGFFHCVDLDIKGIPCQVSRSGYTGEDGFEISVGSDRAVELTELLCNEPETRLAGLGARDSLRLEAGLCLYGNDLNEEISPVEADLLWTMSKKRRTNGKFIGSDVIRDQIANGPKTKRVGFICQKGLAPRAHMKVKDVIDNVVGEVSSGGQSPCLQLPIAMGYVDTEFAQVGTPLKIEIRANKDIDVKVCQVPFVPKGYFIKQ